MAWRDGVPAYGTRPVSRDIRENFAYLRAVTDTLSDSAAMWVVANEAYPLEDAVAGAGGADTTIIVRDDQTLTGDLVVPDNVSLTPLNNCLIDGAFTLTINGPFDAGLYHVFGTDVTVVFSPGTVDAIRPEWRGVDGVADDVEINWAIGVANGAIPVQAISNSYTLAAQLDVNVAETQIEFGRFTELSITTDIYGVYFSAARSIVWNGYVRNTSGVSTKAGWYFYDGASNCKIYNPRSLGSRYDYEIYSEAIVGAAYNEIYGPWCNNSDTSGACVYIHISGSGWANDNKVLFGNLHGLVAGVPCIIAYGNNNIFNGVGCEAVGNYWEHFAIYDYGSNQFPGIRLETSGGGIYVDNGSANQHRDTRVNFDYYDADGPVIACAGGRLFSDFYYTGMAFNGMVTGGTKGTIAVDQDSASGAATLYIDDTSELIKGDVLLINSGGAREEWAQILTITDGDHVVLRQNLHFTHTALQADAVVAVGLGDGVIYDAYNVQRFVVYGQSAGTYNTNGHFDAKGSFRVDGTQVVINRQTGVNAMTNLVAPANWDADTVTTAELADIVGRLIARLRTHGLVGD